MTASNAADALGARKSLPRLVTGAETANRCDGTLQTQESASASRGSGRPRSVRAPAGIWHPACGAQWTGARTAHCACCHLTTTGLHAFEAHQRITDGILQCLPPDKAGLVPHLRTWGTVWSQPGDGVDWWAPGSQGTDGADDA
jgi:hypothetical protein